MNARIIYIGEVEKSLGLCAHSIQLKIAKKA